MITTHEYRGYVFTVTYAPLDPAYVVDFSDIPDIITSGQTLPEAFNHACEALDLHLESLQKLGQTLPEPKHRLYVEAIH
ncbi:MAG: type II toxin-antitoxin system HicB family antitoxin [Candidatus Hydrogenedentes bacterium]|nr:type II toxin-antitoxin system HicB family antitoxin [Candidatus Hydrogenedentota bacterium]